MNRKQPTLALAKRSKRKAAASKRAERAATQRLAYARAPKAEPVPIRDVPPKSTTEETR